MNVKGDLKSQIHLAPEATQALPFVASKSSGEAPPRIARPNPLMAQGYASYELPADDRAKPIWSGAIPWYLQEHYWWAYIHPRGVRIFERQWLVNLILFGNLVALRDAALDELGKEISGRTLQVACVYGDFSVKLASRVAAGSSLDVIDVLPIQLLNLRRKLPESAPVTLHHRDSTALGFSDGIFDQVVIFFLLHEQPNAVRKQTLREALRVVNPEGKIVVVDYHCPEPWNPMRYAFEPVLRKLEPFAPDLWHHDIDEWLPGDIPARVSAKRTFFGGLYQKLVITRRA